VYLNPLSCIMSPPDASLPEIVPLLIARAEAFRRPRAGKVPGNLSFGEVQELSEILTAAFGAVGVRATIVGGGALTLQLPALGGSRDLDVVLEHSTGLPPSPTLVGHMLRELGFTKEAGRHWSLGSCFVEFPSGGIEEPVDVLGASGSQLRVLSIEAMLVQRIVSFQSTGSTEHGIQAAIIIRSIGARLDMDRFEPLARKEGVVRHYNALRVLALGVPSASLDDGTLSALYWALQPARVGALEAVAAIAPTRVAPDGHAPPALAEPSSSILPSA